MAINAVWGDARQQIQNVINFVHIRNHFSITNNFSNRQSGGYLLAGLLTACYDFWQLIKSNDRKSKVISIKRSTSRLVKLLSESKKKKQTEKKKTQKSNTDTDTATATATDTDTNWWMNVCKKLWQTDKLTNCQTDDQSSVKQTVRQQFTNWQPSCCPPLGNHHAARLPSPSSVFRVFLPATFKTQRNASRSLSCLGD